MAEKGSQTKNRSIWLLWTLVSALGFAVGIGLSMAAEGVVGEIVSSVAFGLTVGLAQWVILRRLFQGVGWWILASTLAAPLGMAASNAVHFALLNSNALYLMNSLGFAALGLVVGIAQWWVLRGHLRKAGWWVLASSAGWFVGGLAPWAIRLRLMEFIKIIVDFAVLGIIASASTGLLLIHLNKEPSSQENRRPSSLIHGIIVGCALVFIIFLGVRDLTGRTPNIIDPIPDLGAVLICNDLPPRDCGEDDTVCSELVKFDPAMGPGYIDYPVNRETWDDQYRSYLRRDLQLLIQYASARVACETDGWDYWPFMVAGLGDMSEADGSTPGTSTGHPDHPLGTHEDGNDIDVAYFQKDSQKALIKLEDRQTELEANLLGSMCKHTRFGMDVYHCTDSPRLLDPWRTALFIAYVAESPYTRVIGVDGQIGPILDDALDQLVQSEWIDADLREQIPLAYEATNEGMGWFRHHHHHLHISMYLR